MIRGKKECPKHGIDLTVCRKARYKRAKRYLEEQQEAEKKNLFLPIVHTPYAGVTDPRIPLAPVATVPALPGIFRPHARLLNTIHEIAVTTTATDDQNLGPISTIGSQKRTTKWRDPVLEAGKTRVRNAERHAIKVAEFARSPGGIANARAAEKFAGVDTLVRHDTSEEDKWRYGPRPSGNSQVLCGLVGGNSPQCPAPAKVAEQERANKGVRIAATRVKVGYLPNEQESEVILVVTPLSTDHLEIELAEKEQVENGVTGIGAKFAVTPRNQGKSGKKRPTEELYGPGDNYLPISSEPLTTGERILEAEYVWTREGSLDKGKPPQVVYRWGMTRVVFFIVVGLLVFFSLLLVGITVYLAMERNGNSPDTSTGRAVDLVGGRPQSIR